LSSSDQQNLMEVADAAARNPLAAVVRGRLWHIQRRPDLVSALLGHTGLTLEPLP
jgi:hypothetical protein